MVAPLSGHFATLLRATVRTLLPEHDVFITDWHNARDVPLTAGRFGVDEYVDHLIKFLEVMGPGTHMLAVCQPCVAALAAAAAMADADHPAQPRSLTLMAGPIDTRVNPTRVNELAKTRSIDWFERNLIASVPLRHPGAFRRVYPGFVQLAAFMSMNIDRHVKAHRELYENLANGEAEKAAIIKAFYDEYFAVLDLTAEFYLETVRLIFQEHALPRDIAAGASSGCRSSFMLFTKSGAAAVCRHRLVAAQPAASSYLNATTCRRASAITACFPASAGRTRSIRC